VPPFDARWRQPDRLGPRDWRLGILAVAGGRKGRLTADGKLTIGSATADIGTGTYTIMTQIAAETMGLPIADVAFQLGDSTLPKAPVEGASSCAATVGSAVQAVCEKLRKKVFNVARKMQDSPLADVQLKDVMFVDGSISLHSDPSRSVSIADASDRHAAAALKRRRQ
jgi:xanthine dehydrogenase YagR molybdenum-binding subunit